MICETCGQTEASVQFTEVVGAQKRQRRLCASCAQAGGLFLGQSSGLSFVELEDDRAETSRERTRCERCACTLAHLRRSGRVGCPACYDTFWTELAPLLARVHGATRHFGLDETPRGTGRRHELEGELENALAAGDYLRAARLRDTLRALPPLAEEGGT